MLFIYILFVIVSTTNTIPNLCKEANLAYSPWNNGTENIIVVFSGSLNMPILKFDIFFQKKWRHFFFAFFYIVIFFNHLTKNKYISINSARWTLGVYYLDNQHIKDFFYLNKIKINDGSSEVSVFLGKKLPKIAVFWP